MRKSMRAQTDFILLTPVAARRPGFLLSNPPKQGESPVLPVIFAPAAEALITALVTVAVKKLVDDGSGALR